MNHLSSSWKDGLVNENLTKEIMIRPHISSYLWRYLLPSGEMFLFSMLTGCIDILSIKETITFLEMEQQPGMSRGSDDRLATALAARGYLWYEAESEQRVAENLMQSLARQAMQRPLMFFLCVNHACPVGCRHCFELDIPVTTQDRPMSTEMIQSAFNAMNTIRAEMGREGRIINLFGGEPFLPQAFESVRTALDLAHDDGCRITTFTSGVFLESYLPLLCEHGKDFDWISVTLDVSEEQHNRRRRIHDAFTRTAANIDRLLESGLPVIVRANLDRENIGSLAEMVETFRQRGWRDKPNFRVQISPVTDHHCVRTDQIVLDEASLVLTLEAVRSESPETRILLDRGCYFCLDYLAVKLGYRQTNNLDYALPGPRVHLCMSNNRSAYLFGADGLLYTCDEVVGMPKYAAKQYFPTMKPLKDTIWMDLLANEIPKCRTCPYLFLCGGGCSLAAIARNGKPDTPDCPDVDGYLRRYLSSHEQDLIKRQL